MIKETFCWVVMLAGGLFLEAIMLHFRNLALHYLDRLSLAAPDQDWYQSRNHARKQRASPCRSQKRLRHNAARLQMRICERARSRVGRGGGGGGAQTERAKEQTKLVRNLSGSLPPDEGTTSVGLVHSQRCSSASSVCLGGGAVLIMKHPAANTTADALWESHIDWNTIIFALIRLRLHCQEHNLLLRLAVFWKPR